MAREKKPTFSADYIRDISEAVYREQLGAADAGSMIVKDKDLGQKLRNRAGAYDTLTRVYLKALGIEPQDISEPPDPMRGVEFPFAENH